MHEAEIRKGHQPRLVNDQSEIVLSNSQILRGKLQRTGARLARDAHDIVTASRLDPQSLAVAVNTVPHSRIERAALDWTINYGRIGNNARDLE